MSMELREGQTISVSVGRRKQQYIVRDGGESTVMLQRVPTRKEIVDKLGYDPVSLKAAMSRYWR